MSEAIKLYHGTSAYHAARLLTDGWSSNVIPSSGQGGNPAYLYVTNMAENAQWFADEKEGPTVLAVEVLISTLVVDPEDGAGDTVEDELARSARIGIPAYLAVRRPIPGSAFEVHQPDGTPCFQP